MGELEVRTNKLGKQVDATTINDFPIESSLKKKFNIKCNGMMSTDLIQKM